MVVEHVAYKNQQENWSSISIEKVIQEKSPKVSYKDAIYRCELCGQYVTLAIGGKNGTHFRHPPKDIDCYDKSDKNNYYHRRQKYFSKIEHSLPLRLCVVGDRIELSIGFLPLTESKMAFCTSEKETIKISGHSHSGKEKEALYSCYINQDYFSTKMTKYLIITKPFDHYRLEFGKKGPENYWAKYIDGIRDQGTLFDYDTGKRVPLNGEVKLFRYYYLLKKEQLVFPSQMEYHRIPIKNLPKQWCLYKIQVSSITKETQDFINHFHTRLVDHPIKLIPLWPPYRQRGNILEYSATVFWFYRERGYMKAYSISDWSKPPGCSQSNAGLFRQDWKSKDYQIVTMSQFNDVLSVMDYCVLRHQGTVITDEVRKEGECPFKDSGFNALEPGIHNQLPKDRKLRIESRCDGVIIIECPNRIRKEVFIKMQSESIVDVGWDMTIRLCHGMDCVATIGFVRHLPDNALLIDEHSLLKKLAKAKGPLVPLTHSMGWLAGKLKGYPEVRSWYIQQVQWGQIHRVALFELKKVVGKHERD
ncbi:MAG: hypothetical protein RSB35_03545 [Eubacterium sp.]